MFRSPNVTPVLFDAVGASFVLLTAISKVSLTVALYTSVTVTVTLIVPTSAFSGVPDSTPVVLLIDNQEGNGEALAKVAE